MALNRINTGTTASTETTSTFTPIGAGEYEGRLVYVADLGLQERKFKGEEKPPCQQIALGIELVGNDHADGTPRFLWTRAFNIFQKMDEKSVEYKMYKVFNTSAQADTVADWDAVLGEPCTVKVIAVKSKDGSATYDNISDLIPIPHKYRKDVAPAKLTPAVGDAEDEDNEATKALYGLAKWIWNNRIDMPKQKAKAKIKVVPEEDDVPY